MPTSITMAPGFIHSPLDIPVSHRITSTSARDMRRQIARTGGNGNAAAEQ
jgi:hypothetical protein